MFQGKVEEVAIIGIGCKFPGANNQQEFWKVLRDGENHVIDIPHTRWLHEAFYDADFSTPGRTHARKAGLLQDHLDFDNKLFNIKDAEADNMDPQQRYVLECVHMSLEDAGITRDQIKGSRTSVYVGSMNTDYRSEFNSASLVPNNYTVTGVSNCITSNRVAYVYDLRGAAVTVDTACSSSLVAIHLGVQALRAGDCDMVLCGGSNSILTPDAFTHLSRANMVSPNGQCFAFSAQADGYTRGEGCGMVILKRLKDAQRDKNNVWATINIGCNQDGGTVAPISKPSQEQQTQLLEETYTRFNIDPKRIDFIETHGTGTPVGDVIEIKAIEMFFQNTKTERHRYIGSVKTNIGHLESAAGVAGLIKVLLMMKYSKIVKSLHFDKPNPKIDFEKANLSVSTELIDWPSNIKVACVSSFGFGGTNCHAVVESGPSVVQKAASIFQSEHPIVKNEPSAFKREPSIVKNGPSSVKNESSVTESEPLIAQSELMGVKCESSVAETEPSIVESETLLAESEPLIVESETLLAESAKHKCIVTKNEQLVAESESEFSAKENPDCIVCFSGMDLESLKGSMTDFVQFPDVRSMNIQDVSFTSITRRHHFPVRQAFIAKSIDDLLIQITKKMKNLKQDPTSSRKANIVFVFSGMGTAWVKMGRDFISHSNAFRDAIQEIDRVLIGYVPWSVESRLKTESDLDDQLFWPIAIFSCQVALAKLWKSLGLVPNCVVGYSVGEVAASHIAGYLSLSEAVVLIYHRSRLLAGLTGMGTMILFRGADTQIVEKIVQKYPGQANVSSKISSVTCAVSGEISVVTTVETELRNIVEGVQSIDLRLPLAYHSHNVDICMDELEKAVGNIGTSSNGETHIDMVSTVTGEKVVGPLDAEYWKKNLRQPICFLDAVRKVYKEDENNVFIEVGPKPLLAAHVEDIFPENNVKVIVSMLRDTKWTNYLQSVASVYTHGVDLEMESLLLTDRTITPVPRYNFHPRRVLQSSETSAMTMAGINFITKDHPFLFKVETTDLYKVFLTPLTFKSVYDHKVSGSLIVPGALYAECSLALSQHIHSRKAPQYSVSASFKQPCLFSEKVPVIFEIEMTKVPVNDSSIPFDSYIIAFRQGQSLFATVQLHPNYTRRDRQCLNISQILKRCQQTMDRKDIYDSLVEFGFNYGPLFQLLTGANKNQTECIANVRIPQELFNEIAGSTIHPSILDAMVQTYVILTDDDSEKKEVLPVTIGNVTSLRATEDNMLIYTTVKYQHGNITTFDSTLTTMDGIIVVEMENLELKFLTSKTESNSEEKNTEHLLKCTWMMQEAVYPMKGRLDSHVLYITNGLEPACKHSISYSASNDCSEDITRELGKMKSGLILDSLKYIIFNTSDAFDEFREAQEIQSRIVNLIMTLRSLFMFPLKIPVHVFTRWAIPARQSSESTGQINPTMSAVWGMVRNVILEQSANITVFDLHLPDSLCSLDRMTSVSDFVYENNNFARYKEWMVTESSLSINMIAPFSGNETVPSFRNIFADQTKSVIHVSRGTVDSADSFCVYNDCRRLNGMCDHKEIKVLDTVLPHPQLFSMAIPYSKMNSVQRQLGSGTVVLAIEISGRSESDALEVNHQDIVSLYPCPIGSKVSVPAAATISRDEFENYSPGDLTRLSTLMSICGNVSGTSVTILTSSSDMKLGQILLQMITENSLQAVNVNVVTPEDIHCDQCLKDTVVSLIYLDMSLVSLMVKHWPQAEQLVTVAAFLNKHVKSFLTCHLPRVHVIAPESSDFFQPINILRTVPKVKTWLAGNKPLVSNYLPSGRQLPGSFLDVAVDLGQLLQGRTVKINNSVVRVDQDSLFTEDAVYVVVGGLSGLGWVIVKFLASKGATNIAIFNRRTPSSDNIQEITKICAAEECSIQCFQCDVRETKALTDVLSEMSIKFPNKPLKGIFFGAVVLLDGVLSNVTKKDLESVMAPKLMGAWNLHKLTKDLDLDYFVLHSSISSIIGNIGQTSYGAANAFLDGLASYRRHLQLPGQSINWGPLTVGLINDNDKAKQNLAQRGILFLNEEEILALMTPILLLNLEQIVPCKLDKDIWLKNPLSAVQGSASYEIMIKDDLQRALQRASKLSPDERIDVYTQLVTAVAAWVIGIDAAVIKPESNLQNMGMDSMLAMTLRNEIFNITKCRLPSVILVSGDVTARLIAKAMNVEVQREVAQ